MHENPRQMLDRALQLPDRPRTSFFLWGPRQTGKSTLLRATYPGAHTVDLLSAREFVRLTRDPGLLREEVESAHTRFVVIDEIQKVPTLLDEVHGLIENRRVVFTLCGSSARKVRRGHANLSAGGRCATSCTAWSRPSWVNRFDLGTDILPAKDFAARLWAGDLIAVR
jgi:predicted AAA+ superfamily ATPase